MPHDREDLVRELSEELGPRQAASLVQRMAAHAVPEPSAQETEALIARLRPLVPRPRQERFRPAGLRVEPAGILWAHLAAQIRLFRPVWWLGSLALVLAGLLLADPLATAGLSLAVLAPALVIAGVAYGFRGFRGGALELELACPVSPVQVILLRLLVVLGYDFLLGLLAGLALVETGMLLLSWTACLLLFTGLMLTLTLYMGAPAAALGATLLWGSLILLADRGLGLFTLPGTPHWMLFQAGAAAAGSALVAGAAFSGRLQLLMGRGVS